MNFVIKLQQTEIGREGLFQKGNSPDHKLKSLINISVKVFLNCNSRVSLLEAAIF